VTRVIVVGGGIAGMVVARRLVLGGRDVTLLEASDRLGGTVAKQTIDGIDLDGGAESFATRGGTVEKLARAIGLGDAIVTPNPDGAWLQPAEGQAFRLPQNSMLGIPGSPLAADVTTIVGLRAGFRGYLDGFIPAAIGAKEEYLAGFVRRRMGRTILDQLVRPVVRGVHSADPDTLRVDDVAPGLRAAMKRERSLSRAVLELRGTAARAGSAVAGINGGVFRLAEALEAELHRFGVDVRFGARVTDFSATHVVVDDEHLDGEIVIAAPGLVDPSRGRGHRVILSTLVVDQPLLDAAPRGTGLLVAAGRSDITAKALTHSTAKWAWLAERAGGRHVVRLSYDDEPADLAEASRVDAERLLGVSLGQERVLATGRAQWYRPERESHTPDGIQAAGESIAGTGLASVVAQAEALAGKILSVAS
jgi:oxygen-dependent protoporphyrinogen oxidase